MPSHTAISATTANRPPEPSQRRYSRTSANAKDSHSTSRPDKRRRIRCANSIALPPENSQRHSNHALTNTGGSHSTSVPHSDKRRGTPTAQRTVPPTSAGESHSPSHRTPDKCRGIPPGRYGHFDKQKILPALWLKGFFIVYLYPLGNCRSSPRTATLGPLSICTQQLSGVLPSRA